jgi:hypothetical protein
MHCVITALVVEKKGEMGGEGGGERVLCVTVKGHQKDSFDNCQETIKTFCFTADATEQ